MKGLFKKYCLLFGVIIINLGFLFFQAQTEMEVLRFTGKNFFNFLIMLTPVFICIGLIDVWIEHDKMIRIMGEKSGLKGTLTALLLGMLTAVPLYALLPLAAMFLKKRSRLANVLLFLSASASIRIPLLLFEISSFGWRFTFLRFVLNVAVVFIIAFGIERLLNDADKKSMYGNADTL